MKQISGNKLLVKALKEEGVDVLFGYPGACTIDISDELYKQSGIDIILPRHEQALVHEAELPERLAYVSLPAVPELPTLLQVLQLPTMTAFRLYALPDRLPVTSSETMRSRRLILSASPAASRNTA